MGHINPSKYRSRTSLNMSAQISPLLVLMLGWYTFVRNLIYVYTNTPTQSDSLPVRGGMENAAHLGCLERILGWKLEVEAKDAAHVRRVLLSTTAKRAQPPCLGRQEKEEARTGPATMAFQWSRSSSTALTVHQSGEFFSNSASS
jgi:hypothetical protein